MEFDRTGINRETIYFRKGLKPMQRLFTFLVVFVAAGALTGVATAAPPQSTSSPTIEGNADQPFVGDTLRASRGSWSGSPTSYAYQWDRCDPTGDRQNCVAIAGATSVSYTVQKADVNHTLRVRVTARNADGATTKDSQGTGVVSDDVAPKNIAQPRTTGSATVGSTLTAVNGNWAGASSYTYQWQQCDAAGNACADVAGATAKTYTVRTADLGKTLRVQVTATNKYGSAKAVSDHTPVVTNGGPTATTTTVVTTTTPVANRAPTLRFLSLKVRANRVSVRFRVCDDSSKVTVIDRDQMARRLAYTRKFAVHPNGCATYSRSWSLIPRFRGHGRFVVSLRAVDKSQRLSRLVSRSIVR
jgi:hypothetical protein